jgi:hypothetical protein
MSEISNSGTARLPNPKIARFSFSPTYLLTAWQAASYLHPRCTHRHPNLVPVPIYQTNSPPSAKPKIPHRHSTHLNVLIPSTRSIRQLTCRGPSESVRNLKKEGHHFVAFLQVLQLLYGGGEGRLGKRGKFPARVVDVFDVI